MSLWTRLLNLFVGERLTRKLDEELESHIAAAIEQGRSPEEARRAFGSHLRRREASVLGVALLAALRPVIIALRIDPVQTLRNE